MAGMDKADLDQVFAPGGEAAPGEMEPGPGDEDDDAESGAALDSTIDEIFDSEDPVARREAFKRAIHLCKEEY